MYEMKDSCSDTTICQRSAKQGLERTVCSDNNHRTVRFNGRHHLTGLPRLRPTKLSLSASTASATITRRRQTTGLGSCTASLHEQGRALGSSASTRYAKPVGLGSTRNYRVGGEYCRRRGTGRDTEPPLMLMAVRRGSRRALGRLGEVYKVAWCARKSVCDDILEERQHNSRTSPLQVQIQIQIRVRVHWKSPVEDTSPGGRYSLREIKRE
jgi:hypothetical protein